MRKGIVSDIIMPNYSWMATFFLLSTGIFAFLPYSMDHFKNAEHSCMKCGRRLATQRFGGGTRSHLI